MFFSNIATTLIKAAEKSAIASAAWTGLNDRYKADQAATETMRKTLNQGYFSCRVVIGEGERDAAPMLYIGENLGILANDNPDFTPQFAMAVDPLEGTDLCAQGKGNALSLIAASEFGGLLTAPDLYMRKIAVGPTEKQVQLDLLAPIEDNITALARAKDKKNSELSIMLLDRPRHAAIIAKIQALGCKVHLIQDGDVQAVISTCLGDNRIDMYYGIGGAPEGVLAAAALRCLGGRMQGQLCFRNTQEQERALKLGITDLERVYNADELASGQEIFFVASGVTDGGLLQGVKSSATEDKPGYWVNSLILSSSAPTIRWIHSFYPQNSD